MSILNIARNNFFTLYTVGVLVCMVILAKSFVEHGVYSLQIGPDAFVQEKSQLITTNYPLIGFVAASFALFGVGLWQAKIVMIIFLLVFVALSYFFVKKRHGNLFALASIALLVTFLPLYGNGKSVLGEIPGLVYLIGGLLVYQSAISRRLFVAGILFGLAVATKPLFLLLLPALAAGEWLEYCRMPIEKKSVVFFLRSRITLFLGIMLPLLIWSLTLVAEGQNMFELKQAFKHYSNPYDTNLIASIVQNIKAFVTQSTPIHFLSLFLIFISAKIISWRTIGREDLVFGVFIILNTLFFLKTAGWYRYFFPAHILLLLLFPAALSEMVSYFTELLRNTNFDDISAISKKIVVGIVGMLFVVQMAHVFFSYDGIVYRNAIPREFAEEVNGIVPNEASVFVENHPEISFMLSGKTIYQYIRINPYLTVGENFFTEILLPMYIISDIKTQVHLEGYDEVLKKGHYVLYKIH